MQQLWARGAGAPILIGVTAVAVRLLAINQPFIDEWSWRQSDVAAIARNYTQNGYHFAYPQIDWAGNEPGYVGTEFPLLPFKAALLYPLTGFAPWVGRVQAFIFFALSLPFLFLLVRDDWSVDSSAEQSANRHSHVLATFTLFFYSFAPLGVMTSRCFMPDMPSLSLSIIGLACFGFWLARESRLAFGASAVAVSLAILLKLPTIVIGAPLACLALKKFHWRACRNLSLWVFAAIVLVPSAAWYWHAHRVAAEFYPHHFFGAGGVQLMPFSWYGKILQRMFFSSLTPVLAVLAVLGMVLARRHRRLQPFYWWLATMIVFLVVVGYGNRHPWYQLPFLPICAAFAAVAIQRFRHRYPGAIGALAIGLALLAFLACSLAITVQLYRPSAADLRLLGLELKRTTAHNALIVTADYGDPTALYYAERRGWHFLEREGIYDGHPNTDTDAIDDLEKLRRAGATHIVFYSGTLWWLDYYHAFAEHLAQTATLVEATPQFKIYQLKKD